MKIIFLFIGLLSISSAFASDLKMLTWNVYMLPKPIKFSNQQERIRLMVKHLKTLDHDIILFQEAFHGAFNEALKKNLSHKWPYQRTLGRNTSWTKVMNSGLTIISRHPFRKIGHQYYHQCSGADCFAAKGVLLVQVELPDQSVQLAVTHLQAGQDSKREKIRRSQLAQIVSLLDQKKESGVPQLLIGDLNIDAYKDEFSKALIQLQMQNSPLQGDLQSTKSTLTECMGKDNSQRVAWIDHFLVRQEQPVFSAQEKRVRLIQDYVKKDWCDLSDHRPVEFVMSY